MLAPPCQGDSTLVAYHAGSQLGTLEMLIVRELELAGPMPGEEVA